MMDSRAWPSPTRRVGSTHCRWPSGPRWCRVAVARPSASGETTSSGEYRPTMPHILVLAFDEGREVRRHVGEVAGILRGNMKDAALPVEKELMAEKAAALGRAG